MINIFKRDVLNEGDLVSYRQGLPIIDEPAFLSKFFDIDNVSCDHFKVGLIVSVSKDTTGGRPLALVLTEVGMFMWYNPLDLKLL